MKVSYKECTGELLKLERATNHNINYAPYIHITRNYGSDSDIGYKCQCLYNLDIWDSSKECEISFKAVSLKDVKFIGGEVSFG